ncbi:MAG TPA: hypothetical protein VFT64_09770 [Rickettsiales bacterium]|nr:hypothetical protein [Rickettsiales bacterium]
MKRHGMVMRATAKTTACEDTGFGIKTNTGAFAGVFDGSSLSNVSRKQFPLLRTDMGAAIIGRAAANAAMSVLGGVQVDDVAQHIQQEQLSALDIVGPVLGFNTMEWAATSVWGLVNDGCLSMHMRGDGAFAREIRHGEKQLLCLTRYEFKGSMPPYLSMTEEEYIAAMGGDENAELVTETLAFIERGENGYTDSGSVKTRTRKRSLKFAAHGVNRTYRDLSTTLSYGVATDGVCDITGIEWWKVLAAAWDVRVNALLEPLLVERLRKLIGGAPLNLGDDVAIEKVVL